jgi:hypothetical protein
LPSTGLSRVELFISVRRAAISQVNAAETGNYQRFREALTRARPVTLRSAGTPVMHRGIVAAQPLCKHLRKWQNPALGRSKNSYAESATSPRHAILRDVTGRLALFINGQRSDRRGQGQLVFRSHQRIPKSA